LGCFAAAKIQRILEISKFFLQKEKNNINFARERKQHHLLLLARTRNKACYHAVQASRSPPANGVSHHQSRYGEEEWRNFFCKLYLLACL